MAPDGVTVVELRPGVPVDLPDRVAERLVSEGIAERALGGAPENKALAGAPDNKSLGSLTRAELVELAEERGLEAPARATKGALIRLLGDEEA